MGFQFFQGALCNSEELHESSGILPTVPFGDIGRDGSRGPSNLARHSVGLAFRKAIRLPVNINRQIHGELPDPKVAV